MKQGEDVRLSLFSFSKAFWDRGNHWSQLEMYYSSTQNVNVLKLGKLSRIAIFIICGLLLSHTRLADGASRLTEMEILNSPPQRAPASIIKQYSCLPKDVRADDTVSYGFKGRLAVTVENRLTEMKARCQKGRLVDSKGREIRFFHLSCWGNPPENYQEIRRRETAELARLKKRYTVIEFGCNPMIQ